MNVVQDDLVKPCVEFEGSFEYESTLGASLTVPTFAVTIVTVTSTG